MKVLIAEDDEHIRRGLAEVLEGEGYEVVEAIDGLDALARFRSDAPDLALLDIVMPKLGGRTVFQHIQEAREVLRGTFGHDRLRFGRLR